MLCFLSFETEPAWNLAAEEYLLKAGGEDCFMLWRSRSAVIVGRNQNANAEINANFMDAQDIPLLRRLSGGGAVYHDLGNINFTHIDVGHSGRDPDFQRCTRPILEFLNSLGVSAGFSGRSDLSLNGCKISGNAQYRYRGKVLHHGTLLFDVNLDRLMEALRVDASPYRDKAVQSIRRRVGNVRPHLGAPLSTGQFMRQLLAYVQKLHNGRQATFSKADRQAIETLAETKYRRWEWNFGHSPAYYFSKTTHTAAGSLTVQLQVEKGLIEAIRFSGNGFVNGALRSSEKPFLGCRHCRKTVAQVIASYALAECLPTLATDQLMSLFF